MRIFVRDHGKEQDRRDQNELLELVQFGLRESLCPLRVQVTQYQEAKTTWNFEIAPCPATFHGHHNE
jgi:hypothetical protein